MDSGALLIAAGVTGMLVSTFADSIGLGRQGFGLMQLSGLVIGAILTTAGLVKVLFHDARILVRFLGGIYLSGILYVGLKPDPSESNRHKSLLDFNSFGWNDFAVNTLGFIPLGYLLMLSFKNRQKYQKTNLFKQATIVAAVGGLISLFLEVTQYYLISGRQSSLFDWISNILGTIAGIVIYLAVYQPRAPGHPQMGRGR